MRSTTYFAFAIVLIATTFFSCYKKPDTVAIVHVEDTSGEVVNNARVILYGSGTLGEVVVRDTVYTNSRGEAKFNFNDIYQSGQAGAAVLDIEVSKNGAIGFGLIKVEQEDTSEEKVIL
jgi:hypothetical protein